MGDFVHIPGSSKKFESSITSKKMAKPSPVASSPKHFSEKIFKHLLPLKYPRLEGGPTGKIIMFLLKVAALEAVRRFSKVRCPLIWKVLQGLQVLTYPPFKWIQRWAPLGSLIKGMQKISRPLLLLSVATAFSDHTENCENTISDADDSEQNSNPSTPQSTSIVQTSNKAPETVITENWLLQLHSELEKQGIILPERINEDEIRRFYTAANGDFSCLVKSVRRTIRWRETYNILSSQELEMWSHLVFWHGCDVKQRPCLVIRLGLACSSLTPHDRPPFAQAVVSQLEHGVLYLVNKEDPQITVVMDCEGLSPFRFPMQMMRSCSTLVQDHYPNRLGTLFVIRLPPVVRVIAQTFIQILKPTTRLKLQFIGEAYRRVLAESVHPVPSFLGGKCSCSKCEALLHALSSPRGRIEEMGRSETHGNISDDDELAGDPYLANDTSSVHGNCEQVLRTAILGLLMFWIFIAFFSGMYDPESLSSLGT